MIPWRKMRKTICKKSIVTGRGKYICGEGADRGFFRLLSTWSGTVLSQRKQLRWLKKSFRAG